VSTTRERARERKIMAVLNSIRRPESHAGHGSTDAPETAIGSA
jgi:hypothetical protein